MWAMIFKPWDDVPVYHRLKASYRFYGDALETACGRKVGLHKSFWPFKHAKRIGRACKGCFPSE